MIKKFFSGVVVLLIIGVAAFNVNSVFQSERKLSVLSLSNVEALAAVESGDNDHNETGSKTRKDTQTTRVVTTCDRSTHTVTSTPGYDRTCSGKGYLECVEGFNPTGAPSTTTGSCPWYCFL